MVPLPQLPETLHSIEQPIAIEQSMPAEHALAELQSNSHISPAGQISGPPLVAITHVEPEHVPPACMHAVPPQPLSFDPFDPLEPLPSPGELPSGSNPIRPQLIVANATSTRQRTSTSIARQE